MTLARIAQLEAELDLRQREVERLRAAMSALQEDYAKLDACHRQNLEILQAYAPGSVVRLGHG